MLNKILSATFSLAGASIIIGVLGFMSGVVSLFLDINAQVPIRWLLFEMLVLLSLIIVLLKLIFDLSQEKTPPPPFERPFRYVKEEEVFLIRRNENFLNNIVVGCYSQENEIDRLAYLGVVHLVQDKVIQIKIRVDYQIFDQIPDSDNTLKNLIVRPVVPVTALQQFSNLENNND